MRKRLVFAILSLIIAGIFLYGCYTVLTHPTVGGEEEEAYSGRDYREHCTDCHIDYHNYPYGYYYGYSPDYYWHSPRWGHYYNYPWWWDWYWWDYFWYDDGDYVREDVEKGERRRRKETLAPPYSDDLGGVPPVITERKTKDWRKTIKKVLKDVKEGEGEKKGKETKKEEKKKKDKPPKRRRK